MAPKSTVLQQALEWQVTFWSGEVTDDERHAFQQWLNADARHAAAWEGVRRTDGKLATMSAPGAAPAIRASAQAKQSSLAASRRKSLRMFGVLLGVGAVAYSVRQTPQWTIATADVCTGRGERRQVTLPDGTHITLNTASAMDVVFDNRQRLVRLRSGEILVATSPDKAPAGAQPRPFIVETAQGRVRPIGTRFTVQQEEGESRVAVLEGAVDISPRDATVSPVRLQAGQQTSFNTQQVAESVALAPTAASWTQGLLVAERMRLADFLAELSRYRRGYLRCDPAVADLLVSGVFSMDDTDGALASLVDALPIRLQFVSRYWATALPL